MILLRKIATVIWVLQMSTLTWQAAKALGVWLMAHSDHARLVIIVRRDMVWVVERLVGPEFPMRCQYVPVQIANDVLVEVVWVV